MFRACSDIAIEGLPVQVEGIETNEIDLDGHREEGIFNHMKQHKKKKEAKPKSRPVQKSKEKQLIKQAPPAAIKSTSSR